MNSSEAQPREAAPSQSSIPGTASIIAHPWFPKMIGLWFAALFGLCSLALAPELIERVVTALGIDRIVPAAAPPLGQTARLLLALGMAGVGEIAGLVIGARLAASRIPQAARQRGSTPAAAEADSIEDAPHLRSRDRHPDAPARKPLSATSDLGDDLDAFDASPRAQAEARSVPFVASFLTPPAPVVEPVAMPEPSSPVAAEAATRPVPNAPGAGIAAASLDVLGVVQLSERLALALQARRERQSQAPVVPAQNPAAFAPEPAVTPEPATPELDRGLEVLVRRVPRPVVEPDAPSGNRESPGTAFEPEGVIAAAEGEDLEDLADDILEQGYSSLLAMGSGFQRPETVRIVEPQSDEIEPVVIFPGQGARFAGEPFRSPLARLNFSANAPVVLPGIAPAASDASTPSPAPAEPASHADPEVTDRALRAALASLQRISGVR